MDSTKTTTIETRYTCPETGVRIEAFYLASGYGSLNNTRSAEIRLVLRENAEYWILEGNNLYGGDATRTSEWHGRDIVVPVWGGEAIVIEDDDLPDVLAAAAKACAYLHDLGERHEIEWDGNNHVGKFTFDKDNYSDVDSELEHKHGEPLSDLSDLLDEWAEITVAAFDWFYEHVNHLPNERLRNPKLAAELLQDAKEYDQVRVIGDIQNVIDEVIADHNESEDGEL